MANTKNRGRDWRFEVLLRQRANGPGRRIRRPFPFPAQTMRQLQSTLRAASLLTAVASLAGAQGRPTVNQPGRAVPLTAVRSDAALPPDSVLARSLVFRSIGPAVMSGRISDIAVVVDPKASRARIGTVIYVAAATGGVWKTI